MRKNILLLALLAVSIISGCVTPQQPFRASFNEHEFEPFKGSGTSRVIGQAFLKTRGGDVKFAAGNEVTLLPVTSYTSEIRQRVTINGERIGPADPRLQQYRRTTIADGNGNFEFTDLPAGEYYVSCYIAWEVPGEFGPKTTGGIAYGSVKANPGESVKIILTR